VALWVLLVALWVLLVAVRNLQVQHQTKKKHLLLGGGFIVPTENKRTRAQNAKIYIRFPTRS
jgi:hypothetical protein